jgi:hypothetical protein
MHIPYKYAVGNIFVGDSRYPIADPGTQSSRYDVSYVLVSSRSIWSLLARASHFLPSNEPDPANSNSPQKCSQQQMMRYHNILALLHRVQSGRKRHKLLVLLVLVQIPAKIGLRSQTFRSVGDYRQGSLSESFVSRS